MSGNGGLSALLSSAGSVLPAAQLLQLVGSTALATVIVAVINAVVNRRRLGAQTDNFSANATKAISDAAASTVKDIREDNVRLRKENADLRTRVESLEAQMEDLERDWRRERLAWKRVLQVHAAWDHIAIERLAESSVVLPEAPPLTSPLPSRFGDE